MNDTPTTGVAQATPDGELRRQILSQCVAKNEREWWAAGRIEKLEFELNAANDRIQSLIEERDRANRLAEWKWNLRDEFELLLGTNKIEEGIEAVKEMKRRIQRLEAVVNDPHALWTNWLRGDVKLPAGIGDVRQYQDHIKRLEEAGDAMADVLVWSSGTQYKRSPTASEWRKAKEAKP